MRKRFFCEDSVEDYTILHAPRFDSRWQDLGYALLRYISTGSNSLIFGVESRDSSRSRWRLPTLHTA